MTLSATVMTRERDKILYLASKDKHTALFVTE